MSGPGEAYSLRTTTAENWSGRVELLQPPRGFCLTVREMNDALVWLTIEGAPGMIEAQLWLSAFGVAPNEVAQFESAWRRRLESIFGDAKKQ